MKTLDDDLVDVANEFDSLFKKYGYYQVLRCMRATLGVEARYLLQDLITTQDSKRRGFLFICWRQSTETYKAVSAACEQVKKAQADIGEDTALIEKVVGDVPS